jgi:hypothetical protein
MMKMKRRVIKARSVEQIFSITPNEEYECTSTVLKQWDQLRHWKKPTSCKVSDIAIMIWIVVQCTHTSS